MTMDIINESTKWWSELRHGGILISPILVGQYFEKIDELETYKYNYLRDKYTSFEAIRATQDDVTQIETEVLNKWIDYVIEMLLGHSTSNISKGKNIDKSYKMKTIFGQLLQADRVIYSNEMKENPVLLVSIQKSEKIGLGKGKKAYSDFIDLLRGTGVKVGLITNGVQFRLCYAGIDYDAWTEWDASMWFIESEWRRQLDGFITLLGKDGLSLDGENTKLKKAIEESRNKQSEISGVLGQQIREAVESLINQLDSTLRTYPELLEAVTKSVDGSNKSDQQINASLYQAASRIVMRIVVLLFAEARTLLPRDIAEYNQSYGVEGLFEQLKIALAYESKSSLRNQYSAWRRIISLFNLVHEGSSHSVINIQGYGGILFERGNLYSEDDVLQCISIFESDKFKISDYQVYEILEKIKIGRLKTKQGNKNVWVKGPVDFSDLRTEYIGIMYEGLLDYSLKRANEPLIVMNIGSQPILPLSSLENMNDKEIKDLIKNLKKDSKSDSKEEELLEESDEVNSEDIEKNEILDDINKRAKDWALRVINIEGSIKKKKGMDDYTYKKACEKEADKLVSKILYVGEYYIASQGGSRKGTGTFYTKPGLAVPTTRRTLQPLLYYVDSEGNEIPKKPKDILSIKICDPTCGSGAFLVAATDCITDALTKSILYYESYVTYRNSKTRVLPFGKSSKGNLDEELISVTSDDPRFEEDLRANLMRHVVERCIYGVDINPMAVELAKLALWINTMNRELPFTFLDHKIKVGNGLVGTWFSQFKYYPILAWNREGGDKEHSNGVHYKKGEWTKALKGFMNDNVKPDMVRFIESLEHKNQLELDLGDEEKEVNTEIEDALKKAMEALDEFNNLPMSASGIRAKEEVYKNKIINNESLNTLKEAFDEWCAIWFWPADELDEDVPMPTTFHNISIKAKDRVKRIANEIKFFHWELEFPDVFAGDSKGFTAVLGNPPWDIAKPNSIEFFSVYNPVYKIYKNKDTLKVQKSIFKTKYIEKTWLLKNLYNKSMSNWVQNTAEPFGDYLCKEKIVLSKNIKRNKELHDLLRDYSSNINIFFENRKRFCLQGASDINLYKLFIEQSLILTKKKGRLGLITPAGIYSDKGTVNLRKYIIENTEWEWLFSFENRNRIFDIHQSFKFAITILTNNNNTKFIKSAFMQRELESWESLNCEILEYTPKMVRDLSPENLALLELKNKIDLGIIEKIYSSSIKYRYKTTSEFHMTSSAHLFKKQDDLPINGEFNIFSEFNAGMVKYYPLIQGSTIEQMKGLARCWDAERNEWKPRNGDLFKSQYYISDNDWSFGSGLKLVFRDISNSTNTRSFIGALIPDFPTGNTLNKISNDFNLIDNIKHCALMNSFIFDYVLRNKMVGTHINGFIVSELPVINISQNYVVKFILYASKLFFNDKMYFAQWIKLAQMGIASKDYSIEENWALTEYETLRIRCILDAIVAYSVGVSYEELRYILSDSRNNPKGFWRVDKDKPINMRHTTLTLVAFKKLKEVGIETFLEEDWQLPSDVSEAMGPRFLDWQLEKTSEESWKECYEHARSFLGDKNYEEFMKE